MPFILPDDFVQKLKTLRYRYEIKNNIKDMSQAQQPNHISCFFGAKDVKTRHRQIDFVEKILNHLEQKLEEIDYRQPEQLERYIEEYIKNMRILLAVVLFVKNQINKPYWPKIGDVSQFLKDALQESPKNILDKETKAAAFLEAKQFIQTNPFDFSFKKKNEDPMKEIWEEFKNFIKKSRQKSKQGTQYPIAKLLIPVFKTPMELTGYTSGIIVGEVISKSTRLMGTRYSLTAAIGSGVCLVMGGGAKAGVILLAPTIAGKILDTFCGISLAWLLGKTFALMGTGIGLGIGMSLDLGWLFLSKGCQYLSKIFLENNNVPAITGFSLIDGSRFINGLACQISEHDELTILEKNEDKKAISFEITPEGIIFKMSDEEQKVLWDHEALKDLIPIKELILANISQQNKDHVDNINKQKCSITYPEVNEFNN